MTNELHRIEKKARRYFYEDGLTEIALGLLLLVLGGYFHLQTVLPPDSAAGSFLTAGFVIIVLSASFLAGRLIRVLKRRFVYPRTGYIAYRRKNRPRRRLIAALVGGVMGALLSALIAIAPSVETWMPAINGFLFGFAALLLANKVGLVRYHVLAASSAAIGFILTALGQGGIPGITLFYLIFGAAMAISGTAAFILYLLRSRTGAESGEGGSGGETGPEGGATSEGPHER